MIEDYYGSQFKSPATKNNQIFKSKRTKVQLSKNQINFKKSQPRKFNAINQKNEQTQFNSSRSKIKRTQNSKDKLHRAQQLKRQQINIQKLRHKYLDSENISKSKQSLKNSKGGLQNNRQNVQRPNYQRHGQRKYLKTQNSKEKYLKHQNGRQKHFENHQNSRTLNNGKNINYSNSQQQQYYDTNNYRKNDYTQTQNNNSRSYDVNNKNSLQDRSVPTSKQDQSRPGYNTSIKNQQDYSRQHAQQNFRKPHQRDSQSYQHDSRQFNGVQSYKNSLNRNRQTIEGSIKGDELTVTKSIGNNRYSSLSLNKKLKSNKLLTYYQCETKKFYNYNDEGYLTDRQINCRDKTQNCARQKFYKTVSQNQNNIVTKSISQTQFKYLNRLKAEVDKQIGRQTLTYQVNRLPSKTRQNIDKSKQSKQENLSQLPKSEYPSQLPPSSSLYKHKFKVEYSPQILNQDILKKHQIDDSFHQRQQKKLKKHEEIIKKSAKSSIIKKNKIRKSQISKQQNQLSKSDQSNNFRQSFSSQSESLVDSQKKDNINDGISKIGGIFSDPNSHVVPANQKNENNQEALLQELSKYGKSQNKISQLPSQNIQKDKKSNSKLSQNFQNQTSRTQNKEEENIQNSSLVNNYKQKSLNDLDMINSNYKKAVVNQQNSKDKSMLSSQSQKQTQLIRIQSKINEDKQRQKDNVQTFGSRLTYPRNNQARAAHQINNNLMRNVNSKINIQNQYQLSNFYKSKNSNLNRFSIENPIQKKLINQIQVESIQKKPSKLKQNTSSEVKDIQIQSNIPAINSNVQLMLDSNSKLPLDSKKHVVIIKSRQKSKLNSSLSSQNQFLNSQLKKEKEPQILSQKETMKSMKKQSIISIASNLRHKNSKLSDQNKKISKKQLLGNASINQMQKSGKIRQLQLYKQKSKNQSSNNNISKSFKSMSSYNSEQSFNFLQKIHNLINIQEERHQIRKNNQSYSQITGQFQQILSKIQFHIYLIRTILDVSASAYHIYPEKQSAWVYKSCFLTFKKYILERNKIVQALKGNKTCFKIAQYELSQENLKPFLLNASIKTLLNDMVACNKETQQILQSYAIFLKTSYPQDLDQNDINLRPFNDRNDLGILLRQYNLQIEGLRDKNNEQSMDQQQNQIINDRILHLMETGFLCSQLAGKRIKQYQQQLTQQEEFQQYFQQYWPLFQHILQTFS